MNLPLTDNAHLHMDSPQRWFGLEDTLSNAHFAWRLNPIIEAVSFGRFSFYVAFLFAACLFAGAFHGRHSGAGALRGTLAAGAAAASIIFIFGLNLPAVSFLSAFLLFGAILGGGPGIAGTILGASFILFTANQLAFLSLIFAAASRMLRGKTIRPSQFAISLVIVSIPLFFQPSIPYPDYPPDARLVPGYGVSVGIDPLISGGPLPPVIDREFTEGSLGFRALMLALLSLAVIGISDLRAGLFPLCLAAAVLLDSRYFPAEVRVVSPVQAMMRSIPGYSFFPISIYVLGGGIGAAAMAIALRFRSLAAAAALGLTVLLVAWTMPAIEPVFGFLTEPRHDITKLMESPSLYLLRHEGERLAGVPAGTPQSINELGAGLSASHNEPDLRAIRNKSAKDRWSSLLGRQDGTEWIEIRLPAPVSISGIDLSVPKHSSDYPRGVEISGGPMVDGRCIPDAILFRSTRWLGSILQTPAGYPYYSPESVIIIPFEKHTVQCVRVRQTGRSESYEWSIESIRLYTG